MLTLVVTLIIVYCEMRACELKSDADIWENLTHGKRLGQESKETLTLLWKTLFGKHIIFLLSFGATNGLNATIDLTKGQRVIYTFP